MEDIKNITHYQAIKETIPQDTIDKLPYGNAIRWPHLTEPAPGLFHVHYAVPAEEVLVKKIPVQRYLWFDAFGHWVVIVYANSHCAAFLDDGRSGSGTMSDCNESARIYLIEKGESNAQSHR